MRHEHGVPSEAFGFAAGVFFVGFEAGCDEFAVQPHFPEEFQGPALGVEELAVWDSGGAAQSFATGRWPRAAFVVLECRAEPGACAVCESRYGEDEDSESWEKVTDFIEWR